VAPADPAAVRALAGEVARHRPALGQLNQERLGGNAGAGREVEADDLPAI
jgi:hypothetical protein